MKRWFVIALFINVLLIAGGLLALGRLGGWRLALSRIQHREAPLYRHRQQLFEQLPAQNGAIIFLGDSQTALCEWRELFGDSLPILNRGIAADHVVGMEARLAEVLRHRPAKIFMLIGINDLVFGKSIDDIAGQYRKIVERLRSDSPDTQLVLESVLPVNNQVQNLGVQNGQIQALNSRIGQLARDFALPFVDIYSPLADEAGDLDQRFTEDGLHLNGAGYQVLKQQLEPFLIK